MHVLDCIHDLDENSACCPFTKSHFLRHELEELALLCEFGDQENMLVGFDDFVELDDVGMSEYSHDIHLSVDSFPIIIVLYGIFVYDFYGYFFLGGNVDCFLDLSEGALAQGLANFITLQLILGGWFIFLLVFRCLLPFLLAHQWL